MQFVRLPLSLDKYQRLVVTLAHYVLKQLLQPAPYASACSSLTSPNTTQFTACLLYTSDAADDLTRVDLGGRRII